MSVKKWSQQEVIFSPTSTTKVCILDGADPANKLISVEDLMTQYIDDNYILTKAKIEAVLTGNITSHHHNQYLTAVTKELVEAVLTGTIHTHTHDVEDILNAVSVQDLTNHANNNTHLTEAQRTFLNNLMAGGGLTPAQVAVLDTMSVNVDGDLVVDTNLIVNGAITAYNLGDPGSINYDMLTDWVDYEASMTDWVVAAPLLHNLYATQDSILITLDDKVDDTIEILPGLGISGGGALSSNVTVSLDINNLATDTIVATDYVAFYRSTGHFNSLVSDLPFVTDARNIYTPDYTTALKGGGLTGGGALTSDLSLELDITTLEAHTGALEKLVDYMVIYDASTSLHKKLLLSELPSVTKWGELTGTITNQTDLIDYINNHTEITSVRITLPSSTTVAGRIAGATEGVDYPTGWVLSAGASAIDLMINHGTNKRVAMVTIFAIDGTQEQQLFNTAAYNGIITPDLNNLKIQSLSTIQRQIAIYIIFN